MHITKSIYWLTYESFTESVQFTFVLWLSGFNHQTARNWKRHCWRMESWKDNSNSLQTPVNRIYISRHVLYIDIMYQLTFLHWQSQPINFNYSYYSNTIIYTSNLIYLPVSMQICTYRKQLSSYLPGKYLNNLLLPFFYIPNYFSTINKTHSRNVRNQEHIFILFIT